MSLRKDCAVAGYTDANVKSIAIVLSPGCGESCSERLGTCNTPLSYSARRTQLLNGKGFVIRREMGIAKSHAWCSMPKQFPYRVQRHACHHQTTRKSMPQVMPAEMINAGS